MDEKNVYARHWRVFKEGDHYVAKEHFQGRGDYIERVQPQYTKRQITFETLEGLRQRLREKTAFPASEEDLRTTREECGNLVELWTY